MAKLIQYMQTQVLPEYCCALPVKEAARCNSLRAAALYQMEPSNCGNVEFVLFLSGNSAFRVDVVAFEE